MLNGRPKGDVGQSNPWGVTADKVVNVERGRYYTISFKIKSTLKNEIMKSQDKKDANGNVIKDSEGKAMGENVGTNKYNYVNTFTLKHLITQIKMVQLLSFQMLRLQSVVRAFFQAQRISAHLLHLTVRTQQMTDM